MGESVKRFPTRSAAGNGPVRRQAGWAGWGSLAAARSRAGGDLDTSRQRTRSRGAMEGSVLKLSVIF